MLAYHFSLLFIFFVPLFLQSDARRQSSATFMWLLSVSAMMSLSFLPSISLSQFVTPNINFRKKKKSLCNLGRKLRVKTGAKVEISTTFLKMKIITTRLQWDSNQCRYSWRSAWRDLLRVVAPARLVGMAFPQRDLGGSVLAWINPLLPGRLSVMVLEVQTSRLSLQRLH